MGLLPGDKPGNIPYKVALICTFLPLVSVHLTAVIAMSFDNIITCIPYYSNCYSISATGRGYPEYFVFKGLLIPTAIFMMAYWLMLHQWIIQLSHKKLRPCTVTTMGIIASIALIVYTVTLGAEGEPYALARRIGVVFYFAFTSFGHLILLRYLDKLETEQLDIVEQQNRLLISATVLIGTAILSAFVGFIWDEFWDNWENAYEWWFSLLMISMFYQVAIMWQKTGFQVHLGLSNKD
jgi:hypothetical protein